MKETVEVANSVSPTWSQLQFGIREGVSFTAIVLGIYPTLQASLPSNVLKPDEAPAKEK